MIRKLSVRIAITVFTLALVTSCLMSYFSYFYIHRNEISSAQQTLEELGKTVLRTATIAAYLDNHEIANDVVLGLAQNAMVGGASIVSNSGNIANQGQGVYEKEGANIVRLSLVSPFIPDEHIGELLIIPKQELIEQKARDAALERVFLLSGYTMLVAMFVMGCIQWLFVRPLKQVTHNLHAIIPGESATLIPPASHDADEIGSLVSDINKLLELVTLKLNSERELRLNVQILERRFRMIYDRAGVGIFLLDEQSQIIMANPAFEEMVSLPRENNLPITCLNDLFMEEEIAQRMIQDTMHQGSMTTDDLQLKVSSPNSPRWAHCLFSRLRESTSNNTKESDVYVQGILTDISERKKREKNLQFQAEHDPLTGLFNRRSLEQVLNMILERNDHTETRVAVCLIDLDDFKPINDTHGHEAGDTVLIEVSKRMQKCIRQGDVIARLGGDEFLCVINGAQSDIAVKPIARKILTTLTEPISLQNGITVTVGASIGIAIGQGKNQTQEELLNMADRAMYHVKKTGKNNILIFNKSLS